MQEQENQEILTKLQNENEKLKKDVAWMKRKNGVEGFFYTHIKWLSIISVLFLILLLDKLAEYGTHTDILIQDLRNLIIGILLGIIFSFLLSIKSIRTFLLKSISHFMSDDSYIDRLDMDEVQRIRKKIINRLHRTDIVSNKESLFNHLEKLDKFLSIPHKSIVDEKWIFEEVSSYPTLFKLTRIQDYRVHTLDYLNHSSFKILVRNNTIFEDQSLINFIESNFKITIKVDSKIIKIITNTSPEVEMTYDPNSKAHIINFEMPILLEKEFTQIHVVIEKHELIDNSHAIYSSHAAYHLDYNIQLPHDYKITNTYHNNTLDLNDEQVNIEQTNDHSLSVNINGWQLPGLIFVYTFTKK